MDKCSNRGHQIGEISKEEIRLEAWASVEDSLMMMTMDLDLEEDLEEALVVEACSSKCRWEVAWEVEG